MARSRWLAAASKASSLVALAAARRARRPPWQGRPPAPLRRSGTRARPGERRHEARGATRWPRRRSSACEPDGWWRSLRAAPSAPVRGRSGSGQPRRAPHGSPRLGRLVQRVEQLVALGPPAPSTMATSNSVPITAATRSVLVTAPTVGTAGGPQPHGCPRGCRSRPWRRLRSSDHRAPRHAGLGEVAEHLADEERVALGLGVQRSGEIKSRPLEVVARSHGHEAGDLVAVEPVQVEPLTPGWRRKSASTSESGWLRSRSVSR